MIRSTPRFIPPAPKLDQGGLDDSALADATRAAADQGETLATFLLTAGLSEADATLAASAHDAGLTWTRLAEIEIPAAASRTLDAAIARRYRVLPLGMRNDAVLVAVDAVPSLDVLDRLSRAIGCRVEPCLVDPEELESALTLHYGLENELHATRNAIPAAQHGGRGVWDDSVVRFVDLLIASAVEQRASDVHLQPLQGELALKFRIDGDLWDRPAPRFATLTALATRIKVLAGLDVSQSRAPQDGAFHADCRGRRVDVRVSILPTIHGESLVLRILDRRRPRRGLHGLGLLGPEQKRLLYIANAPQGLVVVSGPTGFGKTTTLHAVMSRIVSPAIHAVALEDPVEYEIPGVRQVQVNEGAGITFAAGLRSILRHDPDVILVGETRNPETADLAVQAALTGHLVFTTLHSQDAPTGVARLRNLGVSPMLIASTLQGVLAQRLVRLVCPGCRESLVLQPYELALLGPGVSPEGFVAGRGCERCQERGTVGRTGIFEVFVVSDEIRRLIHQDASSAELARVARAEGMRPLAESGFERVLAGHVSFGELLSVTGIPTERFRGVEGSEGKRGVDESEGAKPSEGRQR